MAVLISTARKREFVMTAAELRYLIAIDEIHKETGIGVKLTDIATKMGVSKVSVYRAAERLEKNGYAARDEKNKVIITELGAKQLRDYMVIIEFIRKALEIGCGTPSEMAYQDAIGVVCALGEHSRSKVAEYAEAKAEIQLLKKPEA